MAGLSPVISCGLPVVGRRARLLKGMALPNGTSALEVVPAALYAAPQPMAWFVSISIPRHGRR